MKIDFAINKNSHKLRNGLALFALALLPVIVSCATDFKGSSQNSQINWLAPAATIRVEVEVYKGPLSRDLNAQFGELHGIIKDSARSMEILTGNMDYSRHRMNCYSSDQETDANGMKMPIIKDNIQLRFDDGHGKDYRFRYAIPTKNLSSKEKSNFAQACNTLRQLFHDINEGMTNYFALTGEKGKLLDKCKSVDEKIENLENCKGVLLEILAYGSFFNRRATYWASEHVATSPDVTRLRIEMANFTHFAAEYGNQIISRTDALLKQLEEGVDGSTILSQQLPNSVYLRDSAPTAYLNLYDWNEASVVDREKTPAERVQIMKHLVDDNYWSRINTVFAAGQGNVSMALVKDEVGNWNLKGFDNSPGELLAAYKELGLSAVKTATNLVNKSNNVSGAMSALNFANTSAFGSKRNSQVVGTKKRLALMRRETARQIISIGREQKLRDDKLSGEIKQLEEVLGQSEQPESGLRGALKTADSNLEQQYNVVANLESGKQNKEAEKKKLAQLQQMAIIARKKLEFSEAKLIILQTQKSELRDSAISQIQELLNLQRAIIDQMAITFVEGVDTNNKNREP